MDTQMSVAVVVLGKYNRFLAGKRLSQGARWYALPAGRVEAGEEIHSAARQALRHQTGIAAERLAFLGVIRELQLDAQEQPYTFLHFVFAGTLRPGVIVQNLPDQYDWEWLNRGRMREVVPAHRAALTLYTANSPGLVELPISQD